MRSFLGRKKEEGNLYHSLPTQTVTGADSRPDLTLCMARSRDMCDQMENGAEKPTTMLVERETESANEKKRPKAKTACTMRCMKRD